VKENANKWGSGEKESKGWLDDAACKAQAAVTFEMLLLCGACCRYHPSAATAAAAAV